MFVICLPRCQHEYYYNQSLLMFFFYPCLVLFCYFFPPFPSFACVFLFCFFLYSCRKHRNQEDDNRPYIKKPPNAFMLFMKEQRPNVVAELNLSDSAAVNAVLGQRVTNFMTVWYKMVSCSPLMWRCIYSPVCACALVSL